MDTEKAPNINWLPGGPDVVIITVDGESVAMLRREWRTDGTPKGTPEQWHAAHHFITEAISAHNRAEHRKAMGWDPLPEGEEA